MNKIFKNKKIIFGVIAISILGYFVFSDFAEAQQFTPGQIGAPGSGVPGGGDFGAAARRTGGAAIAGQFTAAVTSGALNAASWGVILYGILNLIQYVLWWLISYGYTLLTAAVNMALDPSWFQIDAVLNGWRLVRDFVNIWFILIFLVIAIGTILRSASYQAKKLLPMLILMALVVNFSMPISKFVVDISNVISFQFLKAICPEIKEQTSVRHCDFSANIENALDSKGFSQSLVANIKPAEIIAPASNESSPTNLIPEAHAIAPAAILAAVWTGIQIAAIVGVAWDLGSVLFTQSSLLGGVAVGPFISIVVTNVFLILTAFVILSLGLLFLIRIASLLFLVILSPLGFAAAALPATQKYASEWWNKLLTQSFFAPFSLFFLWISLNLMGNIKDALTQSGVSYDFTSPANARIIFYIFSLILMYGSIWIARKMGAFGAESVIKWWGSIQKGLTGLAGGLAGRLLVAPIGAAALGAGVPEAIGKAMPRWLGGPLAGVKTRELAEYLSKRGKAPEDAAAKAELGMRLAPAERANYFAKLDRAAKEAMLRKMKGDERNAFISDLGTKNLAAAQEAQAMLRSGTFAPEERLKTEAEEFKYSYTLPEQWKKFGSLSSDLQKQFLLSIEDADKRAQFLDHVRDEAAKADDFESMTAFQNANTFLETNSVFSANQQYANKLARYKVEHTEAQKINRLAEFFASRPESEWKTRFRFAMNDSQRLEMVEAQKDDLSNLKKLQGWVREMDPADQDKFDRDSIGKRATLQTIVQYIQSVDTGDPARDFAIKKQVLSGASAPQLGSVAREIPELEGMADDISRTMSLQNQSAYKRAKENPPPPPPQAPAPTGTPPRTPLPPQLSNAISNKNKDVSVIVDQINKITDENLIKEVISRIQKTNDTELTAIIEKRINPIFKVRYIDNIDYNAPEFEETLERTIKDMRPFDLASSVTKGFFIKPEFQKAFVKAVTPEQLFVIGDQPELINTLKRSVSGNELLKTTVAENVKQATNLQDEENIKMIITRDPMAHADAIAEVFETEFNNPELGHFIANIRSRPSNILPDHQKWLKEKLFGKE